MKLTDVEHDLLRQIGRSPIESRWDGADVPGLRTLECESLVIRTGHHGWTYRITPAGRAAITTTPTAEEGEKP